MTTARELHDSLSTVCEGYELALPTQEEIDTVKRALDLLARVEESDDELVRELRGISLLLAYRYLYEEEKTVDRAAAALVALQAERYRLKAHAEAMADAISGPEHTRAVNAYRRDFPKDAP